MKRWTAVLDVFYRSRRSVVVLYAIVKVVDDAEHFICSHSRNMYDTIHRGTTGYFYPRTSVVCPSVCLYVTIVNRKKWLNRSRCHLGHRRRWAQGSVYQMVVHNGATWRTRLNCVRRRCSLTVNYVDHLFYM